MASVQHKATLLMRKVVPIVLDLTSNVYCQNTLSSSINSLIERACLLDLKQITGR